MKLTIELVPRTAWYTNVRSNVSRAEWDIIRRKSYKEANYVCEICGDNGKNQGFNHPVECHEIWEYDDKRHKQKLVGLISLCPYCHKCKHVGLAQLKGEEDVVIKQLMSVNKITEKQALKMIDKAFDKWEERSDFEWDLDISFLKDYLSTKPITNIKNITFNEL
jgi:5-methylcytosine-specific restriction endonuclease McrA